MVAPPSCRGGGGGGDQNDLRPDPPSIRPLPHPRQTQSFHQILVVVSWIHSEKSQITDFLHSTRKEHSSKGQAPTTVVRTVVMILTQHFALNPEKLAESRASSFCPAHGWDTKPPVAKWLMQNTHRFYQGQDTNWSPKASCIISPITNRGTRFRIRGEARCGLHGLGSLNVSHSKVNSFLSSKN